VELSYQIANTNGAEGMAHAILSNIQINHICIIPLCCLCGYIVIMCRRCRTGGLWQAW